MKRFSTERRSNSQITTAHASSVDNRGTLRFHITIQYLVCGSSMEDTMDYMDDWSSDPDLWQHNNSFLFNMTASNTSSVHMGIMSPVMDKTINILLIIVLFITMVSLGCTMEVSKIKGHIVKPKGVAIAVLAQYGVMPLTAFCLAKAFQLAEMTAVVVLICGCCPGGSLSNILALALQGDMNLSIVMTSCSTVLALGMMPLLLYLYCQGFTNLQNTVPYIDIVISLFMILIPCGIGILINYYRPQYAKTITKVGLSILMIAVVVIGILSSIGIGGSILAVLSPPLMAVGALMPLIGYSFGYIISSIFRLNQSERRTVAMETGCQNIQLCSTILKIAFPPTMIGSLFLFPFVYASFQLIEASVLIVVFRCHQWFTRKQKDTYQPATTEDKPKEPCEGTV
ncbi:sodium/bile acid cotransporter-like protein [Lates japonicus]|uniref:Hepatic sodium/bile acid cotransporter n=1 Tax=Lates japonicus TaxID=270547 RepID=A0AAD3QYQ3_LATJO|nr:sodium/bile acid cotransporter-like protein [Lates japonicus]